MCCCLEGNTLCSAASWLMPLELVLLLLLLLFCAAGATISLNFRALIFTCSNVTRKNKC